MMRHVRRTISTVSIVLAGALVPVRGFSQEMRFVARVGGLPGGAAIRGDHAFAGLGGTFAVLDLSEPANPVKVADVVLAERAGAVALDGDLACVVLAYANTATYLQFVDIEDPLAPELLGLSPRIGIDSPAIEGALACGVGPDETLIAIDVSDPRAPETVSTFPLPARGRKVLLRDSIAFVGTAGAGMATIDCTDPASPVVLANVLASGNVLDIALDGSFAYLANDHVGLQVVDVSDPSRPLLAATLGAPGVQVLAVSGDLLHLGPFFPPVVPGAASIRTVDISDPSLPTFQGEIAVRAHTLVAHGSFAYAISGGWSILDASSPTAPAIVGELELPSEPAIAVADGSAVWAAERDRLLGTDLSSPASPVPIGARYLAGLPKAMIVEDDRLYVSQAMEILVFDVSGPDAPAPVGAIPISGILVELDVSGGIAYAAHTGGGLPPGLTIVDLTVPTEPATLAEFADIGISLAEVEVAGSLAFVVEGSIVRILDVSDPSAPFQIGSHRPSGFARGVEVRGNIAYLVETDLGLVAIDVSNPAAPVRLGWEDTILNPEGIAVAGSLALVPFGNHGVRVYDVSAPEDPVEILRIPTIGDSRTPVFVGGTICVPDYDAGLTILRYLPPASEIRDALIGLRPPDPWHDTNLDGHANLADLAVSRLAP